MPRVVLEAADDGERLALVRALVEWGAVDVACELEQIMYAPVPPAAWHDTSCALVAAGYPAAAAQLGAIVAEPAHADAQAVLA